MFTKLWYNEAKEGGGRMKLTKCDKGIYLSNLPKTIIGIICAIAYPIFYIITAYDVFANRFVDIDWFDIFTLIIILPAYILWLIKDFRTSIIRYRITIDEDGIKEYRFLSKNRELSWSDIGEYMCELTSAPYKTNEDFFKIVFYSKDNKTAIQTWSFPNSKKDFFQGEIFKICDTYFSGID